MFNLFGKKKKIIDEARCELMVMLNCELEKIKKWNEETFPDATLGGQLAKLEEELAEFCEAKKIDDMRKELADVFIVLGGLRRWKSRLGASQEVELTKDMPLCVLSILLKNIYLKMDINRNRVWKKSGDGKFHHEERKK